MAKKKNEAEEEIVDVSSAEKFVENNFTKILIGFGALVLLAALAIFLLQGGKKKQIKAETASIQAQNAFESDNWNLAIEGDDSQLGFDAIAAQYKGTKIGNLANYYSGISYMKLQNYEKAIEKLSLFTPTKDPNVNGLAQLNLGDALSELGRNEEALVHYMKAANTNSEVFQADFLFRYGLAQLRAEDFQGAKESFESIKEKFPNNALSIQAENYLAGL